MHERFSYKSKEALLDKAVELGLELPFTDDVLLYLNPAL
jgi:hypothetical protein